jgi:hypothetical protein
VCCFEAKKSRKDWRISEEVMGRGRAARLSYLEPRMDTN